MSRPLSVAACLVACALTSCRSRATPPAPPEPDVAATEPAQRAVDERVTDLTERFLQGMIDTEGPVVDLGEPQSIPSLRTAAPLATELVNGESWARVGTRLRMRVVIDPTRAPEEPPSVAPTAVRLRVRRATARSVAVIVDGLLVRAALLPPSGAATVLTLPVPPDRFRRSVADVELRFGASRAAALANAPVVSLDWVHLSHGASRPARASDLLNDVAVTATPRRAVTLFPPTEVSALMIVPEGAVWRSALAAEAPRGASRPPRPLIARFRVEADGVAPVEQRVEVTPNAPWRDAALDLSPFAGRAARLSIAALRPEDAPEDEPADVRLAVASPRLERASAPPAARRRPRARHVVMVVLRGARADRFLPALSPRLSAGGFATLAREGVVAEATAGSLRAWAATQTAATGLPADVHRVNELTDLLDDEAPTPASVLAEQGVPSSAFTDESVWIASGADRGYNRREGCPEAEPMCRVQPFFTTIADGLRTRGASTFTLVVTRAGALPLDPPNDAVLALDPVPYEGTMTPAQTGVLLSRVRRGELRLDPRDRERLGLLYDAALLAVDRGLATLFERLRDLRQDDSTLVIVVGDRGTALAGGRYYGDGPMSQREIASTVLLARGPGLPRGAVIRGTVGTVDAVATALDALGAPIPPELAGESLYAAHRFAERALPFVATPRGELGLRFGPWLALPRPAPLFGMSLFAPAEDPTGADDRSDANPIARAFAEETLARVRGDSARRVFELSTRAITPAPTP